MRFFFFGTAFFISTIFIHAQENYDLTGEWDFVQYLPTHKDIQKIQILKTDSAAILISNTNGAGKLGRQNNYVEWSGSILIKNDLLKVRYIGTVKSEDKMKGLLFLDSPRYQGRGLSWKARRIE